MNCFSKKGKMCFFIIMCRYIFMQLLFNYKYEIFLLSLFSFSFYIMSTFKNIQLETTPRVYYQHYITQDICYDLYPSLSRQLSNGYHIRTDPTTNTKNIDFTLMNIPFARRIAFTYDPFWDLPTERQDDQWDLYPAILRNVENFGTYQMRQRLHRMLQGA
ncbi:uncharacterized protein RHIMIDRAFT_293614 [Rhizopus microsporus ATCC 52813]|uniref:Uncharacterized protein n=2 Tax=Rhizopus microsporus TaxID=58291 RepID=A0A2G4SN70_RHIZD|nr:uncharacterized protein RHIMIDRAFT_293614 [Rhizopus microsporus ATCC 52813]PHZ10219.1 hypothetical protein RHIMIDRAFT_293614 [Rhizopus microsporus ATCC 52813]